MLAGKVRTVEYYHTARRNGALLVVREILLCSDRSREITTHSKSREEQVMSRKSLIITVLALVGLSTAAVAVDAGMRSQRGGMGCSCCMGDMMGMGEVEGSGGMQGMEGMGGMGGMGKEEMAQQPPTEGRKKIGEQFTCPVDG